jgi:hypothetical protein
VLRAALCQRKAFLCWELAEDEIGADAVVGVAEPLVVLCGEETREQETIYQRRDVRTTRSMGI